MSGLGEETPAVFEVEGVTFAYPGARARVLEGVDLRVPLGRKVCFVGRNGAGKSTLLYLLGLLCEETLAAGRIHCRLPGQERISYEELNGVRRGHLRGHRFGFVLQDAYLMPQLTCAENVAMPLLLQGWPQAEAVQKARGLLHSAGGEELGALHDRQVDTLSGGQRRMMAVLRAIIHTPDVVFADEPTQSLDANYAPRVLDLLERWQGEGSTDRPRTLLLVLHEAELVCARAERVVFLGRNGWVRAGRCFTLNEIEQEARGDGIRAAERIERWIREER